MPTEHIKHSFAPIIAENATVLILGSIPGDKSIAENEYYAHPQNRFWRLLAILTDNALAETYADKLNILTSNGISLWDVVRNAKREGSMDSSIKEYTVNDIDKLLAETPTIKAVFFNGKTAEKFYDACFRRKDNIEYHTMPSTSPANATYGMERLINRWNVVRQYIKHGKKAEGQ